MSHVLFEPLPIERIGVSKVMLEPRTRQTVVAYDFSCMAFMLEEYITLGASRIVVPASAPEARALDHMPHLLQKRIDVVDDFREAEAAARLLCRVRRDLGVGLDDVAGDLSFPPGMTSQLRLSLTRTDANLRRLALGFNHGLQVAVDVKESIDSLQYLRSNVTDPESRTVLAQLEAMLRQYGEVGFDSRCVPVVGPPAELISVFDRLLNDPDYVDFSEYVSALQLPRTRDKALSALRDMARRTSEGHVTAGWDIVTKVLAVWPGVPLPESRQLSSILGSRQLPALLNLNGARQRAVSRWVALGVSAVPLRRDGTQVDDDVVWVSPGSDTRAPSLDDKPHATCKVSELLDAARRAAESEGDTMRSGAPNKRFEPTP